MINLKVLIASAVAGCSLLAHGAGFEDSGHKVANDREQKASAIVGKTLWVNFGHSGCNALTTPQLQPVAGYSSKRFTSSEPAKVFVESLLKSGMARDYYKVIINDSDTAFEYELMSRLKEAKSEVEDFEIERTCVFYDPPTVFAERIRAVAAKRESDEADLIRRAEEMRRRPGAKIGMTQQQVIEKTSWGKPESINRTTVSKVEREQWVYGDGNYLYFTNGRLTAIQN